MLAGLDGWRRGVEVVLFHGWDRGDTTTFWNVFK